MAASSLYMITPVSRELEELLSQLAIVQKDLLDKAESAQTTKDGKQKVEEMKQDVKALTEKVEGLQGGKLSFDHLESKLPRVRRYRIDNEKFRYPVSNLLCARVLLINELRDLILDVYAERSAQSIDEMSFQGRQIKQNCEILRGFIRELETVRKKT